MSLRSRAVWKEGFRLAEAKRWTRDYEACQRAIMDFHCKIAWDTCMKRMRRTEARIDRIISKLSTSIPMEGGWG